MCCCYDRVIQPTWREKQRSDYLVQPYMLGTGLKFSNYVIGELEFAPQRIAALVDGTSYDCVLFEYWHAWKSAALFRAKGIPTVVDTHNILWESYRSQLDTQRLLPGFCKSWAFERYKKREQKAWAGFDGLVGINRDEYEIIKSSTFGHGHVFYAPMGIDLELWPYAWRQPDKVRIGYYGGLGSPRNQKAALDCHEVVMPEVWKTHPSAELWLIGSGPPDSLRALEADSRVRVTGYVEDIQQMLSSMSVIICPFSGTYGFRSRIVEVMAVGVPLVATHDAVAGMDLKNEQGLLLVQDEQDIAGRALALLAEPEFAMRQSSSGRREVERLYSIKATYGRLVSEMCDWFTKPSGQETMRLVVFSHKPCWVSADSPSGCATDGGFPMQMREISELFDATTILVPCSDHGNHSGEMPLVGHNLSVVPLTSPSGTGLYRKARFPLWCLRNMRGIVREFRRADAVHAPIPGDVGTIGMLMASCFRKRLFVRYCGNWFIQKTAAERFWKWFMERHAGSRNVMLATGGGPSPPSSRNPNMSWIFSSSLSERELEDLRTEQRPVCNHGHKLVIVCRQEREKGTDRVIESLGLLSRQFPDISLDVVGDGSALAHFRQVAVSCGVADRIHFHGKVTHGQVLGLLTQADLFCFPTTSSEGFPKVVLEALACGLPVVTTRVSVLPHLIGQDAGVLLDDVTPDTIGQAVESCLADKAHYDRLSQNAVAIAQHYSLETWRDTIGKLLKAEWGPLRSNG